MTKNNGPYHSLFKPAYNFAAPDDVPPDQGRAAEKDPFPMEGNLKDAPKAVRPDPGISDSELSRTEQRFSSQDKSSEFTGSARTISGDIYTNPWEAERDTGGHRWTDSFVGRASTRLVSRGVLGTLGMTMGTVILANYNPHMPVGRMSGLQRTVHGLAGGLDTVFGTPFRMAGKMAGMEKSAVERMLRFRPNANFMNQEQLEALKPLYFSHRDYRTPSRKGLADIEVPGFARMKRDVGILTKTPRELAEDHILTLKKKLKAVDDLETEAERAQGIKDFIEQHATNISEEFQTPKQLPGAAPATLSAEALRERQDAYLDRLRTAPADELAEEHFVGFTRKDGEAHYAAAIRARAQGTLTPGEFYEKYHIMPADLEDLTPRQLMARDFEKAFPLDAKGKERTYGQIFSEESLKRIWNSGLTMASINGRTYGQEMVGITLDFAAGSFFDALGRAAIAGMDPNRQKEWKDKDGHIQYGKLGKAIAGSVGQAFFYNQMEDWFSAPIYAWEMKALRYGLNNVKWNGVQPWRGFKVVSDVRAANSFMVDKDMNVVGTFGVPGGIDLGARFMVYNANTLLARDLANDGYQKFKEWQNNGYSLTLQLPQHPVQAVGHGLGETVKYLGKTIIKSQLYMFPSVMAFFPQRVAQQMHDGRFLNINRSDVAAGIVSTEPAVRPGDINDKMSYRAAAVTEFGDAGNMRTTILTPTLSGEVRACNVPTIAAKERQLCFEARKHGLQGMYAPASVPDWRRTDFNQYTYDFRNRTVTDRILGRLGKLQQVSSDYVQKGADVALKKAGELRQIFDENAKQSQGIDGGKILSTPRREFARIASNNFWAYYPYMLMKDEMARRMDNEVMDASIYRFEDGISSLNWKDFSEGAKDIWHSVWHQPVSDKTYAQSFVARGLTNSRQDLNKREAAEQKALREKTKNGNLAADAQAPGTPSTVIKTKEQEKEGWAPYQVAHASMNDKSVPPGATIH